MNEQHLFFDNVTLNPLGPSLVETGTEHLVIYIDDGTPSCDHALVGKNFEWKPYLWMQHEKVRLDALKKMTIVLCEGVLAERTKLAIRETLETEVCFHDLLLSGSCQFYENSKMLQQDHSAERSHTTYFSIGTMRLPRFIVCAWLLRNGQSVGRPKLSSNHLQMFRQQIARTGSFYSGDYDNTEHRYFGDLTQEQFNHKQALMMNKHRIAVVSEQPWFDNVENFLCEKFTDVVAAKCLPFFIGNGDDNKNIARLGFKSYLGFDYGSLKKQNFIARWQGLLEDNKSFLLNDFYNKNIYEMNKDVIEYNYNHLMETDWILRAKHELSQVPTSVKENVLKFFSKKNPRLC